MQGIRDDPEMAKIDLMELDFDIFATVKKFGRRRVFCGLGRRLLDQSFKEIQEGGDKIDDDLLTGIMV